jgi:hypothetical protein
MRKGKDQPEFLHNYGLKYLLDGKEVVPYPFAF